MPRKKKKTVAAKGKPAPAARAPLEWRAAAAGTLFFMLGFLVGFRPVADMDLHWHLASGRADLAGDLVDWRDPFTHLPIVRSSELGYRAADWFFAAVERGFGLTGVRVLCALALGALYAQAFRLGARRTRTIAGGALAAAMTAALAIDRLQHRPDLFAILFVFLLLGWLEAPRGWRSALAVGGLTALWANVHPSAPLAPALALLALFGPSPGLRLGHVAAAGIGACLTPRGPLFMFELLRDTAAVAPLIPEWQALWNLRAGDFASAFDLALAWLRAALALILAAWGLRKPRSQVASRGDGVMACAAVVGAATSFRLLYLLALPVLWALGRRAAEIRASKALRIAMGALAAVLLVLFPVRDRWRAAAAARASGIAVFADLHAPNFPVAAAAWLRERDLEGHLFHPPEWGGYLAWELAGRYRTAHDGRVSLYGPALAAELLRFGEAGVRASLIARYDLEILVAPPGWVPETEIAGLQNRDDPARRWLRVHHDGTAEILVDLRGPHWERNRAALREGR
jgi:hypothetical protein